MRIRWLGWLSGALLAASLHAQPPPVAAYAQLPEFDGFAVSPSGNRILVLRPGRESQHAVVMDLGAGASRIALASDPERFLINWCAFANEDRILCSVRAYVKLVAGQLGNGFRWYPEGRVTITRLFAVDHDGGNFKELVPDAVSRPGRDLVWNAQIQDRIVSWLHDDPEHVLLQLNRDDRRYPSVYRLDIYRNSLQRVVRHRPSISYWYATLAGDVLLGMGYRGLAPIAVVRDGKTFREREFLGAASEFRPTVQGFAPDNKSFYAAFDDGSGLSAIHEVRLSDLSVMRTVFADPQFDVLGGLMTDPVDGHPLGISYYRDGPHVAWFEAGLAQKFEAIGRALPGRDNRPIAANRALTVAVFESARPGALPMYYLYRDKPRSLTPFGTPYPGIPEEAVATVRAVRYTARDGATIPAYLTLPPSGPQRALATIVMPHGGPYVRDGGGFEYWQQFLASRGYAVLQPNFRGSVGYGSAHRRAGYDQWGERMQEDVLDGLDWLVREGIADPGRVCIVGGSYGGYVAQVAAFKTPDRLRCAVSFAGISDLPAMVENLSLYQLGELTRARMQDGESLKRNSPIHNVNRIGVPLLLVHGDQDRTVFIEQSVAMAEALAAAGKPHRFVRQRGGDHFLSVASQRLEFLTALEVFLRDHLGP